MPQNGADVVGSSDVAVCERVMRGSDVRGGTRDGKESGKKWRYVDASNPRTEDAVQ